VTINILDANDKHPEINVAWLADEADLGDDIDNVEYEVLEDAQVG